MTIRLAITVLALAVTASGVAATTGLDKGFARFWMEDGSKRRVPLVAERQADGAYRFRVKVREIPRKCIEMDIVPDAAIVKKGEGYWVLGDQRTGNLTRDAGRCKTDRIHTYLPAFGLKTADACWVGIVKGLRLEHVQVVAVANGAYNVYPRFCIRKIEFDPYEDAVVDYYPLEGDEANYAGMAKKYRAWNLATGRVKPLAERVKGNPALEWSAKSIFMRCKLSHCDGHSRDNPTHAMPPILWKRTFDDYMKLMKSVKDAGMDYVDMCIVGWQYLGFDGPFPKLWPVPDELGGEAKMREAIAYGKSLGYRMSVHVNNHNIYRACGPELWRKDDICIDENGFLREYGYLQGGLAYHTCFQVVNNRWIDSDLAHLLDMGLNGIHHVDVTSARRPTPCHAKGHPNNAAQMAEWQMKTARKAQAIFGGYSSEAGMDHIAPTLDNVLYVCSYPSRQVPKTELVDGEVPFWQICYNGIIMSNPFWATVDASYGPKKDPLCKHCPKEKRAKEADMGFNGYLWDPAHRVLKVWEYGGRPMFYFQDYATLAPMKEMYDAWQPMKHLQYVFIDRHDKLAEGVYRTRWANGEEIVVNYSDDLPYAYNGRTVKPLDYVFFAKGDK